jgi:WD40 repeat protein
MDGMFPLLPVQLGHKNPRLLLQTQQVTRALLGHKDRVVCVHWLPYVPDSGSLTLVSGSVDGDIVLWAVTKQTHTMLDQLSHRGQRAHTGTINYICSVPSTGTHNSALVCSVAADSQCILWDASTAAGSKQLSQPLIVQQQLSLPCMQMCAELSFVPGHPDWCVLSLWFPLGLLTSTHLRPHWIECGSVYMPLFVKRGTRLTNRGMYTEPHSNHLSRGA